MITKEEVENLIADERYFTTHKDEIFGVRGQVTICVLKTHSGFECVGTSGTTTPEKNFDLEKGQEIARGRAFDDLWEKYAFHVQQHLYNINRGQTPQRLPDDDEFLIDDRQ